MLQTFVREPLCVTLQRGRVCVRARACPYVDLCCARVCAQLARHEVLFHLV